MHPRRRALASGFRPDGAYLDTPSYGLPTEATVHALEVGLDRWTRGIATMDEYDRSVSASRHLYAEIASTDPARVAVAGQVSVFAGLVVASVPRDAHVVVAEDEFTSILFPLLVSQGRGIHVELVPFDDLADAVDGRTDLVAFSAVRSNDGRLADADAIEESARRSGARTLVDVTHAMGWLPLDTTRFDYTVAAAYKWLLSPRGTAFLTLGDGADDTLQPIFAGWYAGEEVWDSIYGGPMRLASSARRFDASPAWLSWLGAAPALECIADIGVKRIHDHNLSLANEARKSLGQDPSNSPILKIPSVDPSELAAKGVRGSVRDGSVRVGFHLYNDDDDVRALVDAVAARA